MDMVEEARVDMVEGQAVAATLAVTVAEILVALEEILVELAVVAMGTEEVEMGSEGAVDASAACEGGVGDAGGVGDGGDMPAGALLRGHPPEHSSRKGNSSAHGVPCSARACNTWR